MILSVSRRTDIPAVYSEWFFNRVKEGFAIVPNPMNSRQLSRISLDPSVVDGIVFWTKNPIPMMERLGELDKYKGRYYFTLTLNAYGTDAEPNIPSKDDVLIPAFISLSKRLGKERVCWRYDPIFMSEKYDMAFHKDSFARLSSLLGSYTEKCTVSFIDMYAKTQRNTVSLKARAPSVEEQQELLKDFVPKAEKQGIFIDTCCEGTDFASIGVGHAHCVDKNRLERIGGYELNVVKDKNQRLECGCFSSIDIGSYDTCINGCLYCYANSNWDLVKSSYSKHDPTSPMLIGWPDASIPVTERKMCSLQTKPTQQDVQLSLF